MSNLDPKLIAIFKQLRLDLENCQGWPIKQEYSTGVLFRHIVVCPLPWTAYRLDYYKLFFVRPSHVKLLCEIIALKPVDDETIYTNAYNLLCSLLFPISVENFNNGITEKDILHDDRLIMFDVSHIKLSTEPSMVDKNHFPNIAEYLDQKGIYENAN